MKRATALSVAALLSTAIYSGLLTAALVLRSDAEAVERIVRTSSAAFFGTMVGIVTLDALARVLGRKLSEPIAPGKGR